MEKGMMGETLTFNDIVDNIFETLKEMDADDVASVHNHVCSRKIRYDEEADRWEYTGEEDV